MKVGQNIKNILKEASKIDVIQCVAVVVLLSSKTIVEDQKFSFLPLVRKISSSPPMSCPKALTLIKAQSFSTMTSPWMQAINKPRLYM